VGERDAERGRGPPEGEPDRPQACDFRALSGRRLQGLYGYVETPGWRTVENYNGSTGEARSACQPTARGPPCRRRAPHRGPAQKGARGAERLPREDRLGPHPAELPQRRAADRVPLTAVRRPLDHAFPA